MSKVKFVPPKVLPLPKSASTIKQLRDAFRLNNRAVLSDCSVKKVRSVPVQLVFNFIKE